MNYVFSWFAGIEITNMPSIDGWKKLVVGYAKCLGLFPFVKNQKLNKFFLCNTLNRYSKIFMTTFLIYYPFSAYLLMKDFGILQEEPPVAFISIFEFIIAYLLILFTYLRKVLYFHRYTKVLNEFLAIDNRLGKIITLKNDHTLISGMKVNFISRIISTPVINILYIFVNCYEISIFYLLKHCVNIVAYFLVNIIAFMIMNVFYYGLLTIYYQLIKVETQVKTLMETVNVGDENENKIKKYCQIADELDKLSGIYNEIFELSKKLNRIFYIEIILHFFNIFLCLVSQFMYIFFMIFHGLMAINDFFIYWIVMLTLYATYLFVEFKYFTSICEKIRISCGQLIFHLNSVETTGIDARLEQCVSL